MTSAQGQGHKGQGQRSQKETSACISETIEATVTKFGTNVLGDNALQIISYTVTLTEGQGHKGQGQRSQKETSAYILETIEATVTKFGTNVLGDNALQIISYTVTLTFGQGQGQRSQKETSACISEAIEVTVMKFGTNVLALQIISYTVALTEVKVTKVRVKGHKKKHRHVSRKVLKLQSPNLAQMYLAIMRFKSYLTL